MNYILYIVKAKQEMKQRENPVPLEIRPITRDELRQNKAQRDEENHQACIEEVIQWFYKRILNFSNISSDGCYKLQLVKYNEREAPPQSMQNSQQDIPYITFITENLEEMLPRIRSLFPDSTVEVKTLSRAPDGKMYDTSSLDANALRFINRQHDQTFLIVDWS